MNKLYIYNGIPIPDLSPMDNDTLVNGNGICVYIHIYIYINRSVVRNHEKATIHMEYKVI